MNFDLNLHDISRCSFILVSMNKIYYFNIQLLSFEPNII